MKPAPSQSRRFISYTILVTILGLPLASFLFYQYIKKQALHEPISYGIEYPVVTHYPKPGFATPDRRHRKDLGWGRYNASITDNWSPSQKLIRKAADRWRKKANCAVYIFNHFKSLQSGVPHLQVVNNVIIGKTLWTFFISPGWKKDKGPYPLIISGNPEMLSNNQRVYGAAQDPIHLPLDVARFGMDGHPIIGAIVNCGGIESQGNHPDILRSIGEGIEFSKKNLGAETQQIVFVGKSRGGTTALLWGANPLDLNYKTAAIFAHAPITEAPIGYIEKYKGVYLALGFSTYDGKVAPFQSPNFSRQLDKYRIKHFIELNSGNGDSYFKGVADAYQKFLRRMVKKESVTLPLGI